VLTRVSSVCVSRENPGIQCREPNCLALDWMSGWRFLKRRVTMSFDTDVHSLHPCPSFLQRTQYTVQLIV